MLYRLSERDVPMNVERPRAFRRLVRLERRRFVLNRSDDVAQLVFGNFNRTGGGFRDQLAHESQRAIGERGGRFGRRDDRARDGTRRRRRRGAQRSPRDVDVNAIAVFSAQDEPSEHLWNGAGNVIVIDRLTRLTRHRSCEFSRARDERDEPARRSRGAVDVALFHSTAPHVLERHTGERCPGPRRVGITKRY